MAQKNLKKRNWNKTRKFKTRRSNKKNRNIKRHNRSRKKQIKGGGRITKRIFNFLTPRKLKKEENTTEEKTTEEKPQVIVTENPSIIEEKPSKYAIIQIPYDGYDDVANGLPVVFDICETFNNAEKIISEKETEEKKEANDAKKKGMLSNYSYFYIISLKDNNKILNDTTTVDNIQTIEKKVASWRMKEGHLQDIIKNFKKE